MTWPIRLFPHVLCHVARTSTSTLQRVYNIGQMLFVVWMNTLYTEEASHLCLNFKLDQLETLVLSRTSELSQVREIGKEIEPIPANSMSIFRSSTQCNGKTRTPVRPVSRKSGGLTIKVPEGPQGLFPCLCTSTARHVFWPVDTFSSM